MPLWGLMGSHRPLQPIALREALNSFVTGLNLMCSTHCICPGNEADQSFSVLLFQLGLLPHLSNGNILDPPTIKKNIIITALLHAHISPCAYCVKQESAIHKLNKTVKYSMFHCFLISMVTKHRYTLSTLLIRKLRY